MQCGQYILHIFITKMLNSKTVAGVFGETLIGFIIAIFNNITFFCFVLILYQSKLLKIIQNIWAYLHGLSDLETELSSLFNVTLPSLCLSLASFLNLNDFPSVLALVSFSSPANLQQRLLGFMRPDGASSQQVQQELQRKYHSEFQHFPLSFHIKATKERRIYFVVNTVH